MLSRSRVVRAIEAGELGAVSHLIYAQINHRTGSRVSISKLISLSIYLSMLDIENIGWVFGWCMTLDDQFDREVNLSLAE